MVDIPVKGRMVIPLQGTLESYPSVGLWDILSRRRLGIQMTQTTPRQREAFYDRHQAGITYPEIAAEAGVSVGCVRYWCRKLQQGGSATSLRRGPSAGLLQTFDAKVRYAILRLRCEHPRWGPKIIRYHLAERASLTGLKYPSRRQIGRYLRQWPQLRRPKRDKGKRRRPRAARRAHERWQIDFKMGIALTNGRQVNLHTIRDEAGAVCIAARLTDAGPVGQRACRVTADELKATLRSGFARWGILPAEVQTDNEPVFVSTHDSPFPSTFTLWLAGLGIRHRQIRGGRPTDNAEVERAHQTLASYAIVGNEHLDIRHLQQQLDEAVTILAHQMPSDAHGCHGQPPTVAHPELMRRPMPFLPNGELALFQIDRVHAYLAALTWTRKVGKYGQVSVGGQHELYSVGRAYARQTVLVHFDPRERHLVFALADDPEHEIQRRPLRNISVAALTGLATDAPTPVPIQMPLPFPVQLG